MKFQSSVQIFSKVRILASAAAHKEDFFLTVMSKCM